jgi:hypothetical protein
LLIVLRASLQFVEPVARHFALSARSLIVHPDRKQGSPGWKHRRGTTTAGMKHYINNEPLASIQSIKFAAVFCGILSSFRWSFAADFAG